MAKDTFTGPLVSLGGLAGGPSGGAPREYSDEIGPSIFWAGHAITGSGGGGSKDKFGPGSIGAVYATSPIRTINAAVTVSNNSLAAGANTVAGTALTNTSVYAAGRAVGVPYSGGGISTTTAVGMDMGLDAATFATAGTVTLATATNAWRYRAGQWIALLNGGAAGVVLMTQIQSIAAAVLTVSPAPAANIVGQVALTNRFNPNAYGATGAPSTISSMAAAGTARIIIPEVGTARGIGITCSASGGGGVFNVIGTNVFGQMQTETITHPGGAVTAWSKKTYELFISATPAFTDATRTYSVVTSDFIGFPLAVLSADSIVAVTLGGTALVSGTNYTVIPADTTFPGTATTGDPRGGIQTTLNGPGAAPGTPSAFSGTILTVDQRLSPLQVALATTINPGPLLGVHAA